MLEARALYNAPCVQEYKNNKAPIRAPARMLLACESCESLIVEVGCSGKRYYGEYPPEGWLPCIRAGRSSRRIEAFAQKIHSSDKSSLIFAQPRYFGIRRCYFRLLQIQDSRQIQNLLGNGVCAWITRRTQMSRFIRWALLWKKRNLGGGVNNGSAHADEPPAASSKSCDRVN
jgi:hypothetical protein